MSVSLVDRDCEFGVAIFSLPMAGFNMYSKGTGLTYIYISCHFPLRNQTHTLPPINGEFEVLLLSCVQILSSILYQRRWFAIFLCFRGIIFVPCGWFITYNSTHCVYYFDSVYSTGCGIMGKF